MSDSYKIHDNVTIGHGATIGDHVIIGLPPKDRKNGELQTIIGDGATIRSHSVIYAGNTIGDNFQTGHGVVIRQDNTIGNNVSIGSQSEVAFNVTIEDGVRIHSQAFIPEQCVLRKNCWIGPRACLTNAPYPESEEVKERLTGVTIEERAKIGANSTILPGRTVGTNALVGAGSVVTKDVEPDTVVYGNPAKALKKVADLKHPDGKKAYD